MRTVLSVFALAFVILASAPSQGKPPDVQGLIDQGTSLFRAGSYEQALETYQRAYAATKDDGLQVLIGRCHEELDQLTEAVGAYERFLGSTAPAEARAKAEGALRLLRGRLSKGKLIVQVEPFGASIEVDGKVVGVAPLAPLEVAPGLHEVLARAPGLAEARGSAEVPGGGESSIVLRLAPAEASAPVVGVVEPPALPDQSNLPDPPAPSEPPQVAEPSEPPQLAEAPAPSEQPGQSNLPDPPAPSEPLQVAEPSEPPQLAEAPAPSEQPQSTEAVVDQPSLPPGSSDLSVWGWATLGTGAALIAGGAVTYALGEADHREIVSAEGYGTTGVTRMTQSRAMDLELSGDTKKTVGYVLWGLGGASVVTSIVLLVIEPDDSRPVARAGAFAVLGGGGLMATGRF